MPNDSYGVVRGAVSVSECRFRMFKSIESQRIQDVHARVIPLADGRTLVKPLDFSLVSSARDRTALAGNAVPRRLMQHHIECCEAAHSGELALAA
jgi:hypothetical protein